MMLTYSKPRERFEVVSSFAERRIPRAAGFRWDPRVRRWWTDQVSTAVTLHGAADAVAKPLLNKVARDLDDSRAATTNFQVPAPPGMEYRGFQLAGIQYAVQREGTLIADEMGLGKTIEAIGVANATGARSVLVLCPASLALNWQRELRDWLIVGGPLVSVASTRDFPGSHVVVCAYSRVVKHQHAIRRRTWDLVILDESHYCKNPRAQRTVAILGKSGRKATDRVEPIKAGRRLALTGTPILNRPVELFPVLRWLDESTWGNWMGYVRRFCSGYKGEHGWNTEGASNLDVLQDRLRASVMVRRKKADVLKELPPKTRQVVLVEAKADARAAIKSENQAWDRHQSRAEELRLEVELAKASTPDEYRAAVARMREAVRLSIQEISKERHRVAVAKAPMVADWVRDALDGGRAKVCVFAHHKDVVTYLVDALGKYGPLALTGDTPVGDRQGIVDAFQTDKRHRVFVGSITAAGVGLTLTAADHAVFAELDWTPANISQAEDRIHRIGQQDAVLIQHIVFDGSLDAKMADLVVKKQKIADESLDADMAAEPVLPSASEAVVATRKAIERDARKLTAQDIDDVHAGLRWLLDVDAFNRWDRELGRRLAGMARLTPKQAALGARLIRKYQNLLEDAA